MKANCWACGAPDPSGPMPAYPRTSYARFGAYTCALAATSSLGLSLIGFFESNWFTGVGQLINALGFAALVARYRLDRAFP